MSEAAIAGSKLSRGWTLHGTKYGSRRSCGFRASSLCVSTLAHLHRLAVWIAHRASSPLAADHWNNGRVPAYSHAPLPGELDALVGMSMNRVKLAIAVALAEHGGCLSTPELVAALGEGCGYHHRAQPQRTRRPRLRHRRRSPRRAPPAHALDAQPCEASRRPACDHLGNHTLPRDTDRIGLKGGGRQAGDRTRNPCARVELRTTTTPWGNGLTLGPQRVTGT